MTMNNTAGVSDDKNTPMQTGKDHFKSQRTMTSTKGWNVFRDPPTATDSGSMTNHKYLEVTLEIIKLVVYFIVFLVVLIGSVVAKGAILLMTPQLREERTIPYCNRWLDQNKSYVVTLPAEERIVWMWCIILAFAVPEVYTFINSVRMCLFHALKRPRVDHFVIVGVMETFHVAGLAIMFMSVLPDLNVLQGAMLANCVCFVPGLLGLLSRNKKSNQFKQILIILVDVLALAAQATAFVVWPMLDNSDPSLWLIPGALVLISCGWWENYVSIYSPLVLIRSLGYIKEEMKPKKHFTYIFIPIWKIITFFSSSVIILHLRGNNVTNIFTILKNVFNNHNITVTESTTDGATVAIINSNFTAPINVLLIQASSAYLVYIFGTFACKILIQRFSLAFPVHLSIPVSISLLISASILRNQDPCFFHGIIPDYLFYESPDLSDFSEFVSQEYVWVWLLWLFSQMWITIHIWSPKSELLASTAKLFVAPMYNGLLIDQSIMLNRNRDDQAIVTVEDSGRIEKEYSDSDNETVLYVQPKSKINKSDLVTKIYACGTMWHENRDEMLDFLKSIMRLDLDQCARKNAQHFLKVVDPDFYEFETHIFFDDAFEMTDHNYNESQVNRFVRLFIEVVDEAATDIHHTQMHVMPPKKYLTPYGGRLVWTLPGNTKMVVHLKDRSKIRHRKRWSQVMYMYYLLGHRIMDMRINIDRKEVIAENTYLLTLDGDVDFRPSAVKLLVDSMKKDKSLGAACGRIHPLGSGPVVWYQMFEYAITHWLQKATEHVIGCVICSPGCFSLFRAKALMDDNVMRKYTTSSNEARHYVQYDQGEDRWLCTLLLQRGYGIQYSAASDAYTHSPKNFTEFYNQRCRWIPSTIANIMDLLANWKRTVKNNDNISLIYIAYQVLLMVGIILGPGTIFLILVGAFIVTFQISIWASFFWNVIPVLLFVIVCFTCKSSIQLFLAAVISVAYALAMMVVIMSIVIDIAENGWLTPTSLFFFLITGILVVTAFMHPQELICLPCGVIYYLTIPSIYMLLVIYSITNLNDITWGTREVKVKKSLAELMEETKEADETRQKAKQISLQNFPQHGRAGSDAQTTFEFSSSLFNCTMYNNDKNPKEEEQLVDILKTLDQVMKRLDTVGTSVDVPPSVSESSSASSIVTNHNVQDPLNPVEINPVDSQDRSEILENIETDGKRMSIQGSSYWLEDGELKKFEIDVLSPREERFWSDLIEEYLAPLVKDKTEKARIATDLKSLRNDSAFMFLILNVIFVLFIFLLQLNQDVLHVRWPFSFSRNVSFRQNFYEVHVTTNHMNLEPISLMFIIFFIPILVIQFIIMLFHRFGTFKHILANTKLRGWHSCKKPEALLDELTSLSKDAVEIVKELQRLDNTDIDNSVNSGNIPSRRKTIRHLEKRLRRTQKENSSLDETFRERFFSIAKDSEDPELLRNTSIRKSAKALKAFETRRDSIISERKKSQTDQTAGGSNMLEATGNSSSLQSSIATSTSPISGIGVANDNAGNDNLAFELEERVTTTNAKVHVET